MPKETFIDDVFQMRHEEPIEFICGLVTRIGQRNAGPSKYNPREEWSFQDVTLCDEKRPRDSITVILKDRISFPSDWLNKLVCFESSSGGKGVKAKDDQPDNGTPERVVWVTGSARVYLEDDGPAHASRDRRREPPQEERRSRRSEPEDDRRPARREREEEPRRREQERDPEPRSEREPERTPEQKPARPPRQEEKKHVELSPKVHLYKMAMMMVECDKSAAWVAKEIVAERQKTNPKFKLTPEEEQSIRSTLMIQGFKMNLHTQFHPPPADEKKPEPAATTQTTPPEGAKKPEDDIPFNYPKTDQPPK